MTFIKKNGYFVEEHFRKEHVINNYNKFSGDEEITKDLNNDLLSEKNIKNKKKFQMV